MNEIALIVWFVMQSMWDAKSAPPPPRPAPARVEFARDVQPILERRCQPCHFPGGSMHAKLPFDRPATITDLNTRLFTRIKQSDEQEVIRKFLAQ